MDKCISITAAALLVLLCYNLDAVGMHNFQSIYYHIRVGSWVSVHQMFPFRSHRSICRDGGRVGITSQALSVRRKRLPGNVEQTTATEDRDNKHSAT